MKMLITMKYSFLINFYLSLEPDVDEHLYLPFVGTKHFKAFGSVNSMLLSTWNSKYVLNLQSMKTIQSCHYVRQPIC